MANATWWVRYTDKNRPQLGTQLLSLSSPDLQDTGKATRRARDTAKLRLAKKGVKPVIIDVRCVG